MTLGSTTTARSTNENSQTKWRAFHRVVFGLAFFFRFFTFAVAARVIHESLAISTSFELIVIMLLAGHVSGTVLAFSKVRGIVGPACMILVFLGIQVVYFATQSFFPNTAAGVLSPYSLLLDFNLLLTILFFGYITTWAYWRVRFFATLELLSALFLIIAFFAPHRDFQLALAPKVVHVLAWELNTSSFALLIILGGIVTLFTSLYIGLAGHAGIPDRGKNRGGDLLVAGKSRPLFGSIAVGVLVLLVSLISRQVYSHYQAVQESVGSNGVRLSKEGEAIGKSPLGFHSALGSNNQPAAVVRLAGDYQENPTSPMLYLREGALSLFNGTDLGNAGKAIDLDIPGTSPGEVFLTEERLEYFERVPVPQSVYLLSDHDVVFTIDYPLSVQPLENPAPQKFKGAYKAYSVAPSYQMESVSLQNTGNPDWPPEVLSHYLTPHTDERYKNFATSVVGNELNPAVQASMLAQYLNKEAIYTLTPNHTVEKGEDPVAPFLFGDLRGYCVHFAHAVVYMLRSLGIPARIGTGYLTDLSQARDGHILLRMSDRHAWAEAYFEGYGWVTFDVQPEQVESHADTEVDSQLLEELMGLIGPENTLIPESDFEDEPGLDDPVSYELPSTMFLLKIAGFFLLLLYIWKLLLWYGWLLPGSAEKKLQRAYRAIGIRMSDLGYSRQFSETSNEFLLRLRDQTGLSPQSSWQAFRLMKYARITPSKSQVSSALKDDLQQLSQTHLVKRFLSFFNPLSVFRDS